MSDMRDQPVYTTEHLSGLKRPEMNRLAKKIGINNLKGKNDDMIIRMIEQSEINECEFDEMGELSLVRVAKTNNVRRHPVLGEYVNVTVTPRDPEIKQEFFGNNDYQCTIRMNEPVRIPTGFVTFINSACYSIEHYYDETKMDPASGKMGLHTQRKIPDFFVAATV